MVKLLSKIPFMIKVPGMAIGILYAVAVGANYCVTHNERVRDYDHMASGYSKIDGAFSSTNFTIRDKTWTSSEMRLEHKVKKSRAYWRNIEYYDGGYDKLDGEVDTIIFCKYPLGIGKKTKLDRDEDYEENKDLFDKADKILRDEKMRFKEHFNFYFENEAPPLPEVEKW